MPDHMDTETLPNPSDVQHDQQLVDCMEMGLIPEFLFEEIPCYLSVIGPDLHIIRANRAFREQFGDQVGKRCLVGAREHESRCEQCPVKQTFADGIAHQSEEVWKVDGQDVHVIVKTAPILDKQGTVAQVLEMSLDVTQLKQLQNELLKRQEEYKYLFDKVPCYLTVVSPDYDIVQTNKAFEQDFGRRIGEKCYKVYKGRDSKCENCPVEQTFIDGATHTSEHLWFLDEQETHIIATTNPIRDDQGRIVAVMEMCTNITEVKRLQSELSLLGETIAGMSHTIKNILSGLQGGVYVVDSGLEKGRDDRVRQGWGMVKNNVEKVSDLVKGILYASKERTPEKEVCDPSQLLTEVCDLYEPRARQEGIALVRQFGSSLGQVLLDSAGIHSAVSNLLANAIEACRSTGRRAHKIVVAAEIAENSLNIRVTDDGTGIPEEVKERLFAKFYSTKGSAGTGLGLMITRKIVEEHGGTINVESHPEKGTTFLISIPLALQT